MFTVWYTPELLILKILAVPLALIARLAEPGPIIVTFLVMSGRALPRVAVPEIPAKSIRSLLSSPAAQLSTARLRFADLMASLIGLG